MLNFLIVGAMKSGTTSLYEDLAKHPGLFLPKNKEPMYFSEEKTFIGKLKYKGLFLRAKSVQLCGEGSTTYTMLPEYSDVARRVYDECGDIKIIYMVRDPISRIRSHLMHDVIAGRLNSVATIDWTKKNKYSNVSSYSMQLKPWLSTFGKENVLVLQFEEYLLNREQCLLKVIEFLKIEKVMITNNDNKVNPSIGRQVPKNNFLKKLAASYFYRTFLKIILGDNIRKYFIRVFSEIPQYDFYEFSKSRQKKAHAVIQKDIDDFVVSHSIDVMLWKNYREFK